MVEKYNEEIQALRAIAVMAVVIHHLSGLFAWDTAKWDSIGQGLWVGVDLFFCISGYVIAKSFLPRVIDKTGTQFWREVGAFWLRRIYRITPTLWLWMLIVMLAAPMFSFLGTKGFSSRNLAEVAAVMMHVENFHAFECVSDPNKCGNFGLFWTLSLEEQFYLTLPFLVLLLRKRLVVGLVALVLAQVFLDRSSWSSLFTLVRTDAICLGVLIAIFSQTETYRALDPGLNSSRLRFIIPPALLFCLFAATRYHIVPFSTGLAAIVSALIVWICSYEKGYFFRASPLRTALSWIGARSYAIYVIHVFAYWFTRALWEKLAPPGTHFDSTYTLRFALTALCLIVVLADLNFKFVEEPLRRRGKKRAELLVANRHASYQDDAENTVDAPR